MSFNQHFKKGLSITFLDDSGYHNIFLKNILRKFHENLILS